MCFCKGQQIISSSAKEQSGNEAEMRCLSTHVITYVDLRLKVLDIIMIIGYKKIK